MSVDLQRLVEVKSQAASFKENNGEFKSIQKMFERMSRHFQEKYNLSMQDILFDIYDEYCPDDEIEPLKNYLAEHYQANENGFDVPLDEGVLVHVDDFEFTEARLVLLPDPARIVLQHAGSSHREVLWQEAS